MKKIRKRQKKLLLLILAIIVITSVIVLIVNIINKKTKEQDKPQNETIKTLPETTYSEMEVKNISMELRKGNASGGGDETIITFDVYNKTDKNIEAQLFETILLDVNENIVAKEMAYITEINAGETQRVEVVYKGDLTATTQIKLVEASASQK